MSLFKPFVFQNRVLGWDCHFENRYFFFGSRHCSREDLKQAFPKFEFCYLKQVHGTHVVAASSSLESEADAHFTQKIRVALVIQTADCVPILLSSADQVCAVHAGWRGLAKDILGAVQSTLPQFKPTFNALGPHIGAQSFEVGADVARELDHSLTPARAFSLTKINGKRLYDLQSLAEAQMREHFSAAVVIEPYCRDTLTDPELFSFRRDREQAGRNLSFVVIKD